MAALTVNFIKTHPAARVPLHGSAGAAGYDMYAVSKEELPDGLVAFDLGLALEIPAGWVGLLFPRSSVYRTGLDMAFCVGVVDSDYRGSVKAIFRRDGLEPEAPEYAVGERVCQLVLVQHADLVFRQVAALPSTAREQGGYGSTGRK